MHVMMIMVTKDRVVMSIVSLKRMMRYEMNRLPIMAVFGIILFCILMYYIVLFYILYHFYCLMLLTSPADNTT